MSETTRRLGIGNSGLSGGSPPSFLRFQALRSRSYSTTWRSKSAIACSWSWSILACRSRSGFITSLKAGVFSVPLSPTTAVHNVAGSVQPRFSWMRVVFPIIAARTASSGKATNEGSQPIASELAETNVRIGSGSTSTGNGSNEGMAVSSTPPIVGDASRTRSSINLYSVSGSAASRCSRKSNKSSPSPRSGNSTTVTIGRGMSLPRISTTLSAYCRPDSSLSGSTITSRPADGDQSVL